MTTTQTRKRTTATLNSTSLEGFINALIALKETEGIPGDAIILEAEAEVTEERYTLTREREIRVSFVTLEIEWPA